MRMNVSRNFVLVNAHIANDLAVLWIFIKELN